VYPTLGGVVREDAALDRLLDVAAPLEVLASGFEWSEGPLWLPDAETGGSLVFSDIPHNRIYEWSEADGLSVYMEPSGYTGIADYGREPGSNGLALDFAGRLVLCEHGDRRVSRLEPGGGKLTLADRYQGRRLNSPNDVVTRPNGDLYFTDPPYGLPEQAEDARRELDFCGVFLLRAEGELVLLERGLSRPNGLAFSPDGSRLYVGNSDPDAALWMQYPVREDGTLGPGAVFADVTAEGRERLGLPDGLKVDRDGNLWATGPGGVLIYTPDGRRLGRVETGQATANCAWGGPDGNVLYVTADSYLCRIETRTQGAGWRGAAS
jgi:gluconolactonase